MEIEQTRIQMLMEIGFLAAGRGEINAAETIFNGIKALRPESESPLIGLAVARMNAGNNQEAIAILRDRALALNPLSDMANSFLGLALKLEGLNSQADSILEGVVAGNGDPGAVSMARALLAENTL